MSDTYRILFCGDVVGKPGRTAIRQGLPALIATYKPLFVVINGENSAAGVGITPDIGDELFAAGADAITLGNHAFHRREIGDYLNSGKPIVRPANMPATTPGLGAAKITKENITLAVTNICGRVFMDPYDDPFACAARLFESAGTPHFLLDFHAEATSEKIAMGYHMEGKATAVLGTHTHVQTNDDRVLNGGTAYITDVGMSGPPDGVLGMDREVVLRRFRTALSERFEVASGAGVISGVVIDVRKDDGRATAISKFQFAT